MRGLELEFLGLGILEPLHALFQFLVDGVPDLLELPLVPHIHSTVGKMGQAADAVQNALNPFFRDALEALFLGFSSHCRPQ